jgi:hypothetical protein
MDFWCRLFARERSRWGWLDTCFADLPDPRGENALRHYLRDVLTIAPVAAICGAESWSILPTLAATAQRRSASF